MGVLRRRWRRGRRWLTHHLEAWQDARFERREWRRIHQAEEAQRLMELNALEQAQTRALLAQLDPHTVNALKAVLKEEVLPILRGEALELARQELAETLAKAQERLADQSAAYREQLDSEVESRIEADLVRATEAIKTEYEDSQQELREQRNLARQQRDAAEHQLLALLRQLLSEKGRYLRNAHIEEFDQVGVNAILKRHGWRVRSKQTYSERTVKTKIDEARWQTRALFWLDTVAGEGVADADEAPEPFPDTQGLTADPLALPEGTGA